MPTYEYACTACGNEFERFESITAKPNKTCPECNAKKSERKISGGGGFIFKGTGFYITDYKKGGKGESKTAAKSDSAAATATTAAPTETPAASGGGGCATGCGCHSSPAPAPAKKDSAKTSSAKTASKK